MARRSSSASAATHHLYADPLIYDILHDDDTRADITLFERLARRFGREDTQRWLEPACGSGRYLLRLAQRGRLCVGLDLSKPMLDYAQQQARAHGVHALVRTLQAPMQRFTLHNLLPRAARQVDAAFNPINSIRHLGGDQAMCAHLACVRAALRPGGVYIVGISLAAYGLEDVTEDVWHGSRIVGSRRVHVTQVVQFLPPQSGQRGAWARRERVISHLTIRDTALRGNDERIEHRDSSYWLRTFSKAQWETLVTKAGWTIAHTCSNTGEAMEACEPGYYLYVLA